MVPGLQARLRRGPPAHTLAVAPVRRPFSLPLTSPAGVSSRISQLPTPKSERSVGCEAQPWHLVLVRPTLRFSQDVDGPSVDACVSGLSSRSAPVLSDVPVPARSHDLQAAFSLARLDCPPRLRWSLHHACLTTRYGASC